jgi:DNA-binding response OmpR family regulator
MAELKPILLVTSRFATLDFVHNTLTAPGHDYEVRTVASAEEAILALRRSSYSLLVSEQQLPGISGAEMAQKVKEMEPKIPIVVIAANSEQRRQVAVAEIDSVYAVEQPLMEIDLIETVRTALRNSEVIVNEAPADASREVSPEKAPAGSVQVAAVREAPVERDRDPKEIMAAVEPAEENAATQSPAKPPQRNDEVRRPTPVVQENIRVAARAEATPARKSSGIVTAAVRGRLELLHADTGARQVMLATMRGDVLHVVGAHRVNGLAQMATAVAANMAGSFDLAEILDSVEPLAIHYQAGERWDLLCANVGKSYFLAILFAAKAGRGQVGTAWIFTRRAVNDLGRLLADRQTESSPESRQDAREEPELEDAPTEVPNPVGESPRSDPVDQGETEDLDRYWDEALEETTAGEEASSAISLEEARRLGLIPPDFDPANQ